MKLLLIGGTGVLSSAVTSEALKQGITVSMINRGNNTHLIPQGVQFLQADISDHNKILSLLKGQKFDAVIDFLCFTEEQIDYSYKLFKEYVNQYVFISSCAVYNTTICNYCEEDSPKVLDVWPYSVDKVNCENYLIKIAQEVKIPYTIIRPCVTYGNTRIPYGIMPFYGYHGTIIERIKHGKPVLTWDGAKNRCNITRVEDFAVGMVGLLGNVKAYNDVFNICGDETPTWKEVLDALSKSIEYEIKTFDITSQEYGKEIPDRKGEILGGRAIDSINSNKKIKTVVPNFKQNIFLEGGIKTTVDHYISNNYLYGMDYAFDADTDRIIAKYAKIKGISTKEMNLRFIDFLGKATIHDKFIYFINNHKDNNLLKILMKNYILCKRIFRKLINIVKIND